MAEKLKLDDLANVCVTSAVLQDLFGCSDRMIRYLVEQGIIDREARGKYQLINSVKGYITTLKISNQSPQSDEDLDLDTERTKHEVVKRQISEIKLQLIKGQVHKSEDVESVITDMLIRFKTKIESLPTKLAPALENENRITIQKVLQKELGAALEELSEYNPKDFYSDEHIEISDD